MDIKRAKQEIEHTIQAYLSKDGYGEYQIPAIRQRPVLLMGPPGIGKTQIMEQIAKDLRIGLVAYTITHHTRQSAVGLPFIKEKTYGGKTYSVTEYTMSEIIASVYEKMEQTGCREGILFIDEINCVSETLAPTMLQFLQGKTFGNQKVPEGWVIVAAGNPPEYNKSVREFDVVTLDRLKKIEVTENLDVWLEYAHQQEIHPAVISYLEVRREHFYRIETTVDGKVFATARGWEDLSELIKTYEQLGLTVDKDVVYQYIQHWKIAKDFANYLELYYKYRQDYGIGELLKGNWKKETISRIAGASFDEKICVIGLLTSRLGRFFRSYVEIDENVTRIYGYLKQYKEKLPEETIAQIRSYAQADYEQEFKGEFLSRSAQKSWKQTLFMLEQYEKKVREEKLKKEAAFEMVKACFGELLEKREDAIETAKEALEYGFDFMEEAFGESQEMVSFVTELNADPSALKFITENGCDRYYRYNKALMMEESHRELLQQMEDMEQLLGQGIK